MVEWECSNCNEIFFTYEEFMQHGSVHGMPREKLEELEESLKED